MHGSYVVVVVAAGDLDVPVADACQAESGAANVVGAASSFAENGLIPKTTAVAMMMLPSGAAYTEAQNFEGNFSTFVHMLEAR